MLHKFLCFIVCVTTIGIQAQSGDITQAEARTIVTRVNEATLGAKHFSASLMYRIYSTHKDSFAMDSIAGFYRRSGNHIHSFLIGIETIQNEHEKLVIDTGTFSISLAKPPAKPEIVEANIEKAIARCKKITLIKQGGVSTLKFIIDPKYGLGYSSIEMTYNLSSYFIGSLTLYYQAAAIAGYEHISKPKVEILYSQISTSKVGKDEFDTDRYISKTNNNYTLNDAFKEYTFFNYLNE